jgi:hypothetical protein
MPEGKETVQRPTHRWEIVMKMDLTETVGGYILDSLVSGQELAIGSCAYSNNFISTQSMEFSYYM